ncbi:hypothetical protein SDC9_75661 [bioreactor metagenome]|uniref:Uncharacterized protein n=1 Tax=bioreactor metagenome TaxID=1076179 RepID=A0A644YKF4_9ZZZZ
MGRLDFVDDFHRPDFRRTRYRSAREGGFDAIERVEAFLQLPFDCRNKLKNGAVVFDMIHFRYLDAAGFADSTQIIAHKIDDHQQFGTVLLAFQQFLAIGAILLLGSAAWPGTFDRPRLYLAVADLQEPFRRTAQ